MLGTARRKALTINTLRKDDLYGILRLGWRDFKTEPLYGMFFGGFYALGGMLIVALFAVLHMPYVGYPMTMGFALIVPFVAAGTYEVSRRLERGEPLGWTSVLTAVWQRSGRELGWMALVTVFTLIVWVDFAIFLFLMFYGLHMPNWQDLFIEILSTERGILFALIGNAIGAVIAMAVFSITVVSMPLLADRDVDFITAMITSVRSVSANPAQMVAWAVLIGLGLGFSILTGFLGLFVVLPVLGHASWHMYRRVIAV